MQINNLIMVKLLICIDICRLYLLFILLRTLQFYSIISDNVEYKSLACAANKEVDTTHYGHIQSTDTCMVAVIVND